MNCYTFELHFTKRCCFFTASASSACSENNALWYIQGRSEKWPLMTVVAWIQEISPHRNLVTVMSVNI